MLHARYLKAPKQRINRAPCELTENSQLPSQAPKTTANNFVAFPISLLRKRQEEVAFSSSPEIFSHKICEVSQVLSHQDCERHRQPAEGGENQACREVFKGSL